MERATNTPAEFDAVLARIILLPSDASRLLEAVHVLRRTEFFNTIGRL